MDNSSHSVVGYSHQSVSIGFLLVGASTGQPRYKSSDALKQKISLFRGDITKLEIDAIVNAGKIGTF